MTNQELIYYYIIDRKTGISYDTYFCGTNYCLAYSNRATDTKPFTINLSRLKKGLIEKRYRLVRKQAEI